MVTVTKSLRMSPGLAAALTALAKADNRSFNNYCVNVLSQHVQAKKPPKANAK